MQTTQIALLANQILNQYFNNTICLYLISNVHMFRYTGDLPFVSLYSMKKNKDLITTNVFFRYYGCQGIVVQSTTPVTVFRELEKYIHESFERFNLRRYLFLPVDEPEEALEDIFKQKEINFVSDLLVVVPEKLDSYDSKNMFLGRSSIKFHFLTHKYVGKYDNNKTILLNTWSTQTNSFVHKNVNLYPDKIANQHGRFIRWTFFEYPPFTSNVSNIDHKYHGSETVLMNYFARHLNMTPFTIINDDQDWGKIYKNWTGHGIMGTLINDKADIGFSIFCGLIIWRYYYTYLDISKNFMRSGKICLVPAPKINRWLAPIQPFTPFLWILIIFVFIVILFCFYFIITIFEKYSNLRNSSSAHISTQTILKKGLFFTYKILTFQTFLTKNTYCRGFRVIIILGILFNMYVHSIYTSKLTSHITIPRYMGIKTVNDFIKSGIFWAGSGDSWITSIVNGSEEKYKYMVDHFLVKNVSELRRLSKIGKVAFPVERLSDGGYALGSHITRDVIENYVLMKEDLYWGHCAYYLRKSSVLLVKLDTFILRIQESGLAYKWQNEAIYQVMDSYVQKAIKSGYINEPERKLVNLPLMHFILPFGFLGIGLLISVFVFLGEILHQKYLTD